MERKIPAQLSQFPNLFIPQVMGILNVTPDSFYDGGRYFRDEAKIIEQAKRMMEEGATWIDIGGYSSRPGASEISEEEEKQRVIRAVTIVKHHFPNACLSVDTFRATVAREAVAAGVSMVNDITGGEGDPAMYVTAAKLGVPYVLMHMRGTPQTMQTLTQYGDLVAELVEYFRRKIRELQAMGISDIVIDPGFGFAKTIDQNYALLSHLDTFCGLGVPVLVGLSRKSMVYRPLGVTAGEALNGTTVLNTIALNKGASILRVHDVRAAMEVIKLNSLITQQLKYS